MDNPQINNYKVLRKIGEGGFGKAYLVLHVKTRQKFVAKELMINAQSEQEVLHLRRLSYPYIVKYVDCVKDATKMYIVMEYCTRGNLKEKILEKTMNHDYFPEKMIIDWFVQICLALKYIHEKNVMHRDIKPENIFVTDARTLKVGDFGISKTVEGNGYTTTYVGTKFYMPPEIKDGEMWFCKYNNKCDIWCLGRVLCELCMPVYANPKEWTKAYAESKVPYISRHYENDFQGLVNALLQINPQNRPSAKKILEQTPFLVEHQNQLISTEEDIQIKTGDSSTSQEMNCEEVIENMRNFTSQCEESYTELKSCVKNLTELTNTLENVHRKNTIASLSGGVFAAAGGITSIVGLVLAPFTLGASLIVTGVGIGVGVAGGVTSAASNITNVVQQKKICQNINAILINFQAMIGPILDSLNSISKSAEHLTENKMLINIRIGAKGVMGIAELARVIQVANIGKVAAQAGRLVHVAGAITGVLSSLLLALDIYLIYKDAKEINEMRKNRDNNEQKTDDSRPTISEQQEKISSETVKFIKEMRQNCSEFENILMDIETTWQSFQTWLSDEHAV